MFLRVDWLSKISTRAVKDLVAICAATALALFLAFRFDAFENFERWARAHERWEVDELIIVPVVLAIAFAVYYWRKSTQLQHEFKERKETEEALRRSEERFRALVQNASDVILIMEADRSVRYISPAVERVLGYKPEEVMGQDNFTPVHPDDMARLQEVVAKAVRNPGTTFPPGVAP